MEPVTASDGTGSREPQPTDKCEECGADYNLHHHNDDSCPANGQESSVVGVTWWTETKFTPVPSPDSVRDMGEAHTANSFIGHYLKRTAIEESLTEVLNEIFHKEVQPTAARLEEALKQVDKLKKENEAYQTDLGVSYDRILNNGDNTTKYILDLRKEVERYKEALENLHYFAKATNEKYRTKINYLFDEIEAVLSGGATEQSTEQ